MSKDNDHRHFSPSAPLSKKLKAHRRSLPRSVQRELEDYVKKNKSQYLAEQLSYEQVAAIAGKELQQQFTKTNVRSACTIMGLKLKTSRPVTNKKRNELSDFRRTVMYDMVCLIVTLCKQLELPIPHSCLAAVELPEVFDGRGNMEKVNAMLARLQFAGRREPEQVEEIKQVNK